jgi:hypothetical protein
MKMKEKVDQLLEHYDELYILDNLVARIKPAAVYFKFKNMDDRDFDIPHEIDVLISDLNANETIKAEIAVDELWFEFDMDEAGESEQLTVWERNNS